MDRPYVAPATPCDHVHPEPEFKIHLNELVCICGARRRLYGPDQTWKRRDGDIDWRTRVTSPVTAVD